MNQKRSNQSILIEDAICAKCLVNEKVVQTSKNTTNNTKNYHCDQIRCSICRNTGAEVKHYQSSLPKETTVSTAAEVYKSSQYHSNYCCCEKCSPKKGTSPPENTRTMTFL